MISKTKKQLRPTAWMSLKSTSKTCWINLRVVIGKNLIPDSILRAQRMIADHRGDLLVVTLLRPFSEGTPTRKCLQSRTLWYNHLMNRRKISLVLKLEPYNRQELMLHSPRKRIMKTLEEQVSNQQTSPIKSKKWTNWPKWRKFHHPTTPPKSWKNLRSPNWCSCQASVRKRPISMLSFPKLWLRRRKINRRTTSSWRTHNFPFCHPWRTTWASREATPNSTKMMNSCNQHPGWAQTKEKWKRIVYMTSIVNRETTMIGTSNSPKRMLRLSKKWKNNISKTSEMTKTKTEVTHMVRFLIPRESRSSIRKILRL